MREAIAASHRPAAFSAAAILLMVAGASAALQGALPERGLQLRAGAVLLCAGALLFKLWKQNPR
jgi:hypothetical protein